eukprot:scaffold3310_cov142-Amphora_coffeaeformis.AAC.2
MIERPKDKKGCSKDQIRTILCFLHKKSQDNAKFVLFSDANFLEKILLNLLAPDKNSTVRIAFFYACNKVPPECRVLGCSKGDADINDLLGRKLKIFPGHEHDFDEGGFDAEEDLSEWEWYFRPVPCPARDLVDSCSPCCDKAAHFVLTREQASTLGRRFYPCCDNCMTLLTNNQRDGVDVKSILGCVYVS